MSNLRSFIRNLRASQPRIQVILFILIAGITLALALSIGAAAKNPDVARAGACDTPRILDVAGTLEQSEAWGTTKAEWIRIQVQKDARYLLQASNAEGLELAVFDRCDAGAPAVPLHDGRLEFTATRDGEYYLLVKQDGLSSQTGYQVSLSPAAPYRPSVIAAQEVPTDVLRRATEFLEKLRGSGLAPEWQDARINPQIGILYRPDIQGPAYYEARVEKPSTGGYQPAGYILLASGDHDYLIVNWNSTGMSTSQELAELAPLGATLTQIYRLNTLSYAAEYEQVTPIGISAAMTDVVTLGELPDRIEGLDALPDEPFELVTQGINSNGQETYEGPANLPLLTAGPWDSWAALKAGYAEDYAPLNRSLAQRASKGWELEKNLGQYGETLVKGDVRTIYGLATQTLSSIQVTGAGAAAQYLKQEQVISNTVTTGIILTVLDEPAVLTDTLPFDVALQYTSGVTETLKYAIANHSALTFEIKSVYLPVVGKPGSQGMAVVAPTAPTAPTAAAWGPWHYYWVDSSGNALAETYNQIPAHTGVNTSNCWSGCGATAWAMLFAWVDRRAAESHPTWLNEWGIYRVNGGLGADAVAPLNQDAGVNNMTWELRGELHTFCSGSGGATYFTDMIRAADYVRPRVATWSMHTRYDPTGLCWFGACDGARNQATDTIIYQHAPVVIGANNHYPLAVGYAWQSQTSCFLWWCSTDYNRWFYVNQGWGGSSNGWVDYDDVAFSGKYDPVP